MRARAGMARAWAVIGVLLIAIGPAWAREPRTAGGTLRVFAAASLSDAFTEMGRRFERGHPGWRVRTSFAGSQQLASQLEQGATADVFASADERWMSDVGSHHLLADDAQTFAHNRLVVIVPNTNPGRVRRIQDLSRRGIKLVVGADAVPVGHYSRALLRNLSAVPDYGREFAANVLRNVVSEEENVKSVVGKVQLGEADAGIVYRSDVTAAVAPFVRVFEVPPAANVVASYPIAVLREAPSADAARAFVTLALSPEGQQILGRHGLMSAASASP